MDRRLCLGDGTALSDIFDELQEEVRAERMRRLALRWGSALGVVALVAALGAGGWQGWRWYQSRQSEQAAELFLETSRAAEQPGADPAALGDRFAQIASAAPDGYRTLARLRAAALKAEAGDRAAALALWDAVAQDPKAGEVYRELASLMWVMHGLDSEDPGALASRVAPLSGATKPWRYSAQEMQGLVALRQGQKDEARKTLQALAADETAPQGLRDRAARLAAGLEG